jgi:hypothetical protein
VRFQFQMVREGGEGECKYSDVFLSFQRDFHAYVLTRANF